MSTTEVTQVKQDHLLNDKQYFILNNLALVVLPAVGTLYFALAQIWGLPGGKEVLGSIVACDTFLGVLVKVGESSYDRSGAQFDGAINVSDTAEKTVYSIDLNDHPDTLKNMTQATFKINQNPAPTPPVVPPSQ